MSEWFFRGDYSESTEKQTYFIPPVDYDRVLHISNLSISALLRSLIRNNVLVIAINGNVVIRHNIQDATVIGKEYFLRSIDNFTQNNRSLIIFSGVNYNIANKEACIIDIYIVDNIGLDKTQFKVHNSALFLTMRSNTI